ncbi:MAG: hypothetical protein QUV06_04970 [Cyanobium sp. CZS 48M]|nr:hypothetical protein [Cyanobium sp. CZS48M]
MAAAVGKHLFAALLAEGIEALAAQLLQRVALGVTDLIAADQAVGAYPRAAWRIAAAQRETADVSSFLAAFLSTQHQAEPLASPEQAADAEYRYRVQLLPGTDPHLEVQCWRRMPGGGSWINRCRPMPLAAFIQRFLPGDQL